MKGFRYLRNVATLELDRDACTGCGKCLEVCPHRVFALVDRRALVADLDACMECGACMRNCPAGALRVDAGMGCAAGILNEWLGKRGIGGAGGCCRS